MPDGLKIWMTLSTAALFLLLSGCGPANMDKLLDAAKKNDTASFGRELNKGFDKDRLDLLENREEMTLLHLLASDGKTEMVKMLLDRHVNVDLRLETGDTPLVLLDVYTSGDSDLQTFANREQSLRIA